MFFQRTGFDGFLAMDQFEKWPCNDTVFLQITPSHALIPPNRNGTMTKDASRLEGILAPCACAWEDRGVSSDDLPRVLTCTPACTLSGLEKLRDMHASIIECMRTCAHMSHLSVSSDVGVMNFLWSPESVKRQSYLLFNRFINSNRLWKLTKIA